MIPLSVPSIQGNEWTYVKECLDTEWVSSVGKYVTKFEEDICNYTASDYAVACVNGTAALQVALQIVGVQAKDEIIVPTVTFIAPVNAARYLGVSPVFMDCDEHYTMDVEKACVFIKEETELRKGYTYNKQTGRRISAIIPVHVFGNAVKMDELLPLCLERNIKIVEDAAESIGTTFMDDSLANRHTGTVGDIGCYSFNGNKIITTGGGGMIVTNNHKYAERAKYLTTQAKDDPIYYIHNEIGYNFRLTNVQAAMGVAQLEKLPAYIQIKQKNYEIYKQAIDEIPGLFIAPVPSYANSNYWFYCLQIDANVYGMNRDQLLKYLQENGIQTRPIWHLNHLQKPYAGFQSYRIERAFDLFDRTLNIPCSVNLTPEQIQKVIKTLQDGKR